MHNPLTELEWLTLKQQGYLRIASAVRGPDLVKLTEAVDKLLFQYPYGFVNQGLYQGKKATPRTTAPGPTDRQPTIIFQNVGFEDPTLLDILKNPYCYALIEKIVGPEFYLSNTWLQCVPPETGRLGFHKDPRGSITLCVLLDPVTEQMGSTCLIPGSHLNTPPASLCIDDIGKRHLNEVELTGETGDIIVFTPETWHGRSANLSNQMPRRLFYNFYSRSSRETTAWYELVTQAQIDASRAKFPSHYGHLFRIDREETRRLLQVRGGPLRRWALSLSSENRVTRDYLYCLFAYGPSQANHMDPRYLLPYTTRLLEGAAFSGRQYLSRLSPIAVSRALYREARRRVGYVLDRVLGGRVQQPHKIRRP